MKDYPVIKIAILFTAGILSAQFFQLSLLLIALLFLVTVSVMLFYKNSKN